MIIDVALASEATTDLTEGAGSAASGGRRAAAIAARLRTTSRLVFDSKESRGRVTSSLQDLPPTAAGIWQELLHPNGPYCRIDQASSLDDAFDAASLQAWQGHADLVVLSRERRDMLEKDGELPDEPEVCDFADIAHSQVVEDLEAIRQAPVLANTKREDLWNSRFRQVCEKSRRVHIIDHYAAEQVLKQEHLGHAKAAAGVEWFFRKMALTDVRRVRLVTRHPDDFMAKDGRFRDHILLPDEVREVFEGLAVRTGLSPRLKTYIVSTPRSRDFLHERHLIFDERLAFTPHNGLASFNEGRFRHQWSCVASAQSVPAMIALFDEFVAQAH